MFFVHFLVDCASLCFRWLSLKQGTGNRGMGERGMGTGIGNEDRERGMGTGYWNGEWERGMGTGNGNGSRNGSGYWNCNHKKKRHLKNEWVLCMFAR